MIQKNWGGAMASKIASNNFGYKDFSENFLEQNSQIYSEIFLLIAIFLNHMQIFLVPKRESLSILSFSNSNNGAMTLHLGGSVVGRSSLLKVRELSKKF